MKKFRKRSAVVEAVRWDETVSMMHGLELIGLEVMGWSGHGNTPELCQSLRIKTREGTKHVFHGDWIVHDENGFYPYSPIQFATIYERAASGTEEGG